MPLLLNDGYAPTPGTVLSREYIECQAGKIKATLKCDFPSEIFDPIQKSCTSNILGTVDAYCSTNPSARFSDPTNCARYYDCTMKVHHKGLNPYQSECQYLYLYDESIGACTLFYMMATPCGNRSEPKAPCDYRIGQCVDRAYCMACSASCVGQPDGKVPYPGIPSTRYHLVCRDERTMEIQECEKGFIFDTKIQGCIPDIDQILTTTTASTTTSSTTSTTASSTTMSTTAQTTSVLATTASTTTSSTTSTAESSTAISTTAQTTSVLATTASTTTLSTTSTPESSTAISTTATTSVLATTTDAAPNATEQQMFATSSTETTATTDATSTAVSTDATSTVDDATSAITSTNASSTSASTLVVAVKESPLLQTKSSVVCPCDIWTSLTERLDNLTSITNSLTEHLQVTARSPFDCIAPPVSIGTVAQIYYEGSIAVARYACAVEGEALCGGLNVSRCTGGNTWSSGPRCGRVVWQNVTTSSITLDCPPAAHASLCFTIEGVNDFSVKLEEDDTVPLRFHLNVTEGVLVIANGADNMVTLNVTRISQQTDWIIYFNNVTLDLFLDGFRQGGVFFPTTNFTGEWTLTVAGNGKFKEVQLKPPGSPLPVPRAMSGAVTGGAAEAGTNLALMKPVFASAYMNKRYKLETVVDGIKDNNVNDNDCFMTAVMEPWVMVDLGAMYHVTAIILTRSDSFVTRLRDIQVLVYTQNPEVIPTAVVKSCAIKPGQLSYRKLIRCEEPVIGRFVRVEYLGVRDILTICEMEVFGAKVTVWSPFLCPEPPLLDKAMVDVHYSLTAAVAVYTCDDGYSSGCDNSNMVYCTSEKGWEGRPQACTKVDSGTEDSIGRVEIACPLQIGFAHELWVEPKESGSYLAFQVGADYLLVLTVTWSQGGTQITFRNRINGVIKTLRTDSSELFKNETAAHIVVLFLSDHYQFLVDNQPLIAVPHMTSSPNIDVINGNQRKMFIKRVKLNQDWSHRVYRGNNTNYSLGKSTFASSNVETSNGVVDGVVTYTTLSSTCWQAADTDETPFWEVDTGGYYHINGVKISARSQDGCLSNCDSGLHDFAVDVYLTHPRRDPGAKAWLCQFYNGYVPLSASEFIHCRQENVGRYVILRSTRKIGPRDLFTVCELEVWGRESVMKALPVYTWTPRECPLPPVLDNMSVQISYTLTASVATYTCDDNYTVCDDDNNSVVCEGEVGWEGEPSPCVKIVERVAFQDDNSSIIFGCPFRLGTRIEAWFTPNISIPRYHISLESSNSTEVIVGLSFDSVSAGEFLTLYNGTTEEAISVDPPALQVDPQYRFAFTFYSDYIQATVDGVLIREYPHYQMSHRTGSLSVSGLTIKQVWVTRNKDVVREPIRSNLAQNKPAISSTSREGTHPGLAVDGNARGKQTKKTCWSHAENDTDVFWEVDLKGYYYIRNIVITSNAEPHDFEISVRADNGKDEICALYNGTMEPESTERLVCGEELLGRYVKIVPTAREGNSDRLSFCEVEVYGISLKPPAWSPFHCGSPPVEENSVTSLTYSATQAVATYTCRDNYTTCDDVNTTVMTCSSGQHWKGTPIKCVQNVFEYTDQIFGFRPTCELTIFSSLEVWAAPSPGIANLSLQIGNNTITFTAEMKPNDSTLIGSVTFGNLTSFINTSLSSPGHEHYFVFTIRPDSISIEIDKTEVTQLPHIYDSLKTDYLRFENIAPRKIKMNIGNIRGVRKVPLTRNMALGKQAAASTRADQTSLVVDGFGGTCWQTTAMDSAPWWQVDLKGYYYIDRVVIHRFSKCSDCVRYYHDLQIKVYENDPKVQADSDFVNCNTYLAEKPFPMKTSLDCLSETLGRFVRITRLTTPGSDDVMALCEVEVFVSKLVKGQIWTPFSCPPPPLADINPMRMSYTATEATATYQCQDGFSVCGGSDVIKCNSSAGWSSREMSCKQTTFEEPGDFLTRVDIQCPLTVGDVLEAWVSSTDRLSMIILQADSETMLALSYTRATETLQLTHVKPAASSSSTTAEHSPPLVVDEEWHVVIAFLSEHILIEINGRPVMTYPHYVSLHQMRVFSSPAGFKLRKVSMSKWRHAFLEPPLVNFARDKTCTANSNVLAAKSVVDGDDKMSGSCWSATASSDPVWWQVDLGGYYIVTKAEISSRRRCGTECNATKQLHDFSVDVFMDDPTKTEDTGRRCYTYDGTFPLGTTQSFVCQSPIPGRYARLTRQKVRPEDEFTVCEVKVFGNKVIKKDSGPYDCVLPPPPLDGANAEVRYTHTRMQAIYTCKAGYAPCGLESPTCACVGGIWQAIRGSCYQRVYRYPRVSSSTDILLNCPMVYSTRFHIFATPTLGQHVSISLRDDGKHFLNLKIFFNHRYYQNVSRVSNSKEDVQSDVFPFVIGEEFHVVISYFTNSFSIEANSVPLVTALPSTVHDGVVPEVSLWGPMAVRELRFEMPSDLTYYKDMHVKSEKENEIYLPITTTETSKYFRVKACKDVVIDVKGGLLLEDHVQFILGARENTKTDCSVCPVQRSIWHSPLSCDEYRTFWLDWSNGLDLKIGAGSIMGVGLIFQAPFSSDIAEIKISGTTNVINVDDLETCGTPESPPLNMVIAKHQRQSRESTSISYTCVNQTYMFCGEDNVANCTKGVVGSQVKGECRKMTWQPNSMNFTAFWPCRVTEGSTLSLYLNESRTFSVQLGDFWNTLLQLDASFSLSSLTVGHKPKSGTETKNNIPTFPFTTNKKFHMTVTLSNKQYKISVDGIEVASYNDALDYRHVAYVIIQADHAEDVRIFTPENGYKDCSSATVPNGSVQSSETSVGAKGTATCHSGHSFCGTSNTVTCWSDGTWRFDEPIHNACQRNTWTDVPELKQDTDFGVPCELTSATVIYLQAAMNSASQAFQMQLVAAKEILLRVRYIRLSDSLTASTWLGRRSVRSETVQNHGFIPANIDLTIAVTPAAFNISLSGGATFTYAYESSLKNVKLISVSSGTRIMSLNVLDKQK
ncbi:uncharacterized protein [Haliotis asinina]|uniref:uncharacterized protein isoform X2 n=1 Tax=Haliotis asinina TaxID=109174 RepID=UPI0035326F27